jgi:hypothetical protein
MINIKINDETMSYLKKHGEFFIIYTKVAGGG